MEIGENIKKYRNKIGLTQKELAIKVGVTPVTIQNYENNRREPNIETLNKIAEALSVSIGNLINYSEVKKIADKKEILPTTLMVNLKNVDFIDNEFIEKYKLQLFNFYSIICNLKKDKNSEKLISIFNDILMNIDKIIDVMFIETQIVQSNDSDFGRYLNLSKYDYFYNCLMNSKSTKGKLLENVENLQFSLFDSRYDEAITNIKKIKMTYDKIFNNTNGNKKDEQHE